MSRASLALALALPALGLAELGLHLFFAHRPPTPADWEAARPRVAALRGPGDAVLIAPTWAEPHARMAFGPALMPLRDIARPDESRYARVVEVSALGQRSPELAGWRPLRSEPLGGGLTARLLENPAPARVVFDFTDAVDDGKADAAWVFADHEAPCPLRDGQTIAATGLFSNPTLPARRHVCGPQPWQSVAVTVHDDQRWRPRRCIWSHPPQGGAARLRFAAVPLGRVLRGHGSIHWTLEREQRGAPVFIDIAIDGQPLGTVRHDDGQGWALFELPLGPHAGKTAALVEFSVHSPNTSERQFCWEADTRDPP